MKRLQPYLKIIIPAVIIGMFYGSYRFNVPMNKKTMESQRNRMVVRVRSVFGDYLRQYRAYWVLVRKKIKDPVHGRDKIQRNIREKKHSEGGVNDGTPLLLMPRFDAYATFRMEADYTWSSSASKTESRYGMKKKDLAPVGTAMSLKHGKPVSHGPRNVPRISLTLDSGLIGGDGAGFNRIINVLMAYQTPVTFFLTGKFIEHHPDVVRRLAVIPYFEVANHSYTHIDLTHASPRIIGNELKATQERISRVAGTHGLFFRPPYGKTNYIVSRTAARLGLTTVLWDVESQDYRKDFGGDRIVKTVMDRVRNGSIVLMHMNGERSDTADILKKIIPGLHKRGFQMVTVSRLLEGCDGYVKENGHPKMSVEKVKEKVVYGLGY